VPARQGLIDLHEMERAGEKIAWLTAYDYSTAQPEEAASVDMIPVGDSPGMCVYGYPGTVSVTLDQCTVHSEAMRRGGAFPEEQHCYRMLESEQERCAAWTKEER
jgi:3-methyl-2-oxobutanoate hydroxymethyltransferase